MVPVETQETENRKLTLGGSRLGLRREAKKKKKKERKNSDIPFFPLGERSCSERNTKNFFGEESSGTPPSSTHLSSSASPQRGKLSMSRSASTTRMGVRGREEDTLDTDADEESGFVLFCFVLFCFVLFCFVLFCFASLISCFSCLQRVSFLLSFLSHFPFSVAYVEKIREASPNGVKTRRRTLTGTSGGPSASGGGERVGGRKTATNFLVFFFFFIIFSAPLNPLFREAPKTEGRVCLNLVKAGKRNKQHHKHSQTKKTPSNKQVIH